jgi:hypothetical protein
VNVKENERVYSYVVCALENAEWVEFDGRRVPKVFSPLELFTLLTGMDPDSWRKAIYKRWDLREAQMGTLEEYT